MILEWPPIIYNELQQPGSRWADFRDIERRWRPGITRARS